MQAVGRLVLVTTSLLGMLSIGGAPVASRSECADADTWPSFAEVAPTARAIVLVRVSRSDDGIAQTGHLVEVLKGSSMRRLDLRSLEPGASDGCATPPGPYALVGDRLAIAFDGAASDRPGRIDAVAHVGRMRDRSNRSGLERLTFEEARAYDASEPECPEIPCDATGRSRPNPARAIIRLIPWPLRKVVKDVLEVRFHLDSSAGSAHLPRLAPGEPTVEPDPGSSPPTPVMSEAVVGLGRSFALMVGETAVIEDGLTARFVAVIGDSRCPSDVECVWEGDAEIEVEVVQPGESPASLRLHTNPSFSTEAAYLGHMVELIGLEPYPRTDSESDEAHIATLVVNRGDVDATPTLGAG